MVEDLIAAAPFLLLVASSLHLGRTRTTSLSLAVLSATIIFMWSIIASSSLLGLLGLLAQPLWGITACSVPVAALFITSPTVQTGERERYHKLFTCGTFVLSVLLLLLVAGALWITWISEPTNIDDLYYHYPKVLHLFRTGHFVPSGLEVVDGYPQNGELLALFIAGSLNALWLSDSVQIFALPLYIASVSLLCRSQGIERRTRIFLALLSCFVPAIWSLLITLHADFLTVALLIGSIATIINQRLLDKNQSLFLISASMGLLLGTKYVVLPWVLMLFVWTLCTRVRPATVKESMLLLIPLTVSGSTVYLLNLLRFGNPLYPYTISICGLTLKGRFHSLGGLWEEQMTQGVPAVLKILKSWFSPEAIAQANHEHWYGGLGTLWPYLFLMISITTFYRPLRDRRLLGMVGLGTFLLLSTPVNFTARFTIFLVPFGVLALGKVLTYSRAAGRVYLHQGVSSLALLCAFHCTFQFVVLATTELKLGIRATSLAGSCKRAARPSDLKILSNRYHDVLESAQVIDVDLGERPEDRLRSFACFWALAPESELRFHEASDREALDRNNHPSRVVLRPTTNSHGSHSDEGLILVYEGEEMTLLQSAPTTVR